MPAGLKIAHGSPAWASDSIRPSKDQMIGAGTSPILVTPAQTSTDVYVYVKVENSGNVDLGVCSCSALGLWSGAVFLAGFRATDPAAPLTEVRSGTTFTLSQFDDSIAGAGFNRSLGHPGSGRRAWGWSPDGNFFAYASAANAPIAGIPLAPMDWNLSIVAVKNLAGTTIKAGDFLVTTSGVFAGPWTNAQFGWLGSRAVSVMGAAPGGGVARSLHCPLAPSGKRSWGDLQPSTAGQTDWVVLISPCEETVAYVPKKLNAAAQPFEIFLRATADPTKTLGFRVGNVPAPVTIVGANPTITTVAHTANGVEINTGAGAIVTRDDPDCTVVGGGVLARVDRVKFSTLPSANTGVVAIGNAAVFSLKASDPPRWAQVPNTNGWVNHGEKHWCLLAQTFTGDGTTIPRPWNGQASNPPVFPVTAVNCAQRNISIDP